MYIREKTIKRGEKEYSYYQLVEGERVDGRVRQRVIKHLGRLPTREHADMVARQMGLLCSALKCGRRGTVERRNHKGARALFCAEHVETIRAGEAVLFYPLY
jgi:hypothetical protein